ncbi:Cysteine desulfurase [Novipirellula galeiformis]|uniref:cysteine desulfurase n=2 Tax=Novipirellula galeiformis TaxID=2528004 RepID=A0A5C6CTU9_9BACT|nr:Cysteine desulfurase [Novipirellula galeiformis]
MIYLDNHATTRCDPRVVQAMLPWLSEDYGNPSSVSHDAGHTAAEGVQRSAGAIASALNAPAEAVLFTSGATESNNLAIRGVCLHPRQKKRHFVTVASEHHAVLDVADDLEREGIRVTRVPVVANGNDSSGLVDLDRLAAAIEPDTALVSVMWANNEIGSIAPMKSIAQLCHSRGALLHSDATQAVGRIPVDIGDADVDLVSATAHKFYGPKGIGFLLAGNGNRRVRLKPQIVGGGQQHGLRSGTLNPAGIVAMATALTLCVDEMESETARIAQLRNKLFDLLCRGIEGIVLNGPPLTQSSRLAGNLNFQLDAIEGAAWMSATPELAFSSGSACSSADAAPSHVLTALGLSESAARCSVRFGIGRFNTDEEIEQAANRLIVAYTKLRQLS